MATARGITETKLYDHEAVIERYGIPPELIPDFYGLKGDTSDNIPGVPGIGDKTAAQLLQQFGSLEEVLAHVDDISGAKRKENLVNHADDARVSKRLATVQRDVPVDIDPATEAAREPDRSRLREVFREFELRDPLRRLEEVVRRRRPPRRPPSTARALKAACARAARRTPRGSATAVEPLAIAVHAPEAAGGRAVRARGAPPLRRRVRRRGDRRRDLGDPAELVAAIGERPVIAHDVKALGARAARRSPTTRCSRAFLLDPARRAFPFAELIEERGLAADVEDAAAADALLVQELAARQRERARRARSGAAARRDRAAADLRAARHGARRRAARHRAAGRDRRRASRDEIHALEREIWDLCGEEFVIGSPQQLGAILFDKLGLSKKRRGKTGFSTDARVLQSIRDEHEVIPKIERWRELNQLTKTYLEVLPALVDSESRIHTTFIQSGASTGPARIDRPEPPERPGAHAARPRDPRLLRGRAGQRADQRRLLAGRAAGARARRRRAGAQGDLHPRRGRAHGDGARGLPGRRGGHRRGHALEVEDDQLRDRLRAQRLRARRPPRTSRARRRRRSSTPTSRASRASRAFIEETIAQATTRATSRRSSGAGATSPSCVRATTRCARSASGSPSTP